MIATTIEQSKHLLEIGLDPNTSDMYYTGHRSIFNPKEIEYTQVPRVRVRFVSFDRLEIFFPAWSLTALLEVMPANIKIDDDQYFLYLEKDDGNIQGERYTCYYFSYYTCEVDDESALFSTASYDNTIDAAYEMVCWLLEQGLIKKGGQDDNT